MPPAGVCPTKTPPVALFIHIGAFFPSKNNPRGTQFTLSWENSVLRVATGAPLLIKDETPIHAAGPMAVLRTAVVVGVPVQMVWVAADAVQLTPLSIVVMGPVIDVASGPRVVCHSELVAGLTATLPPMACVPNGLVTVVGQFDEVAGVTA